MIFTALTLGRRLVSRGRSAGDELGESLREIGSSVDDLLSSADRALTQVTDGPRTRKLPLVLAGFAVAVGGYLVGRRTASSNELPTGSSYPSFTNSPGRADADMAVAASRPQPPEAGNGSASIQPPEAESAPVKAAQEVVASSSPARSASSASAKSNGETTAKKPSSSAKSTKATPKGKPSQS